MEKRREKSCGPLVARPHIVYRLAQTDQDSFMRLGGIARIALRIIWRRSGERTAMRARATGIVGPNRSL